MKTIEQYRQIIEEAIECIQWPARPENLYDGCRYAMAGGGKRLRPILTLAFSDALNGDEAKAVTPALAVEIFHNFTLVHDDIMDNSDRRHGRESVWAKYGEESAILIGDVMAAMPVTTLTLWNTPVVSRHALLEYLGITAKVLEGQQQDIDLENNASATLEDYIEMITHKTAALFHLACSLGAIAAERSDIDYAAGAYGRNLGIAFQIQDDLLDTYGDPEKLGKPVGGDILNDKNTILRLAALEKAPIEMAAIEASGLTGEKKIEATKKIYDSLHLHDVFNDMISGFIDEAIDSLKPLKLRKEKKQFFINFANGLLNRQK